MGRKLFDLNELSKTKNEDPGDKAAVLRDNFLSQHDFKVETLKSLTGRLPKQGEFFALWTIKSFNAFTFIPFLIKELDKIDYLVLSTYSINRRIIDSLMKKIDQGKIDHVKLFISDSLKYRMPRVVDHLSSMINTREKNISVHYSWNHSKITLVQCGDQFFCIEGSGNWSENAQYEQYLFFNDKRMYDFRLSCITNDLYRRTD
jgi:hypothetical protein